MNPVSFAHAPWPDCTAQVMSYDDAAPDFPGTHGSGFFVHFQQRIFFLTARHCLGRLGENLAERAARLMIPIVSGYPSDGTEGNIDYERLHVVTQGIELIGQHVGLGPYPHTRTMRVVDENRHWDLDGISGGPVYMRVSGEGEPLRFALVGLALNGVFPVVHFATVEWLVEAVRKCGP